MIAWIILPFMNCAIEAVTLFRSAAAFETHLWLNGGNTEGEATRRPREWVIAVDESCCLRRIWRRGLTCPRGLGWTEAGTIAALQNTPTSSFPLVKLLSLLNDGVSTVATCALTIQPSAFSVMQRSLKLGSAPPHLLRRKSSSPSPGNLQGLQLTHEPQTQPPLRLGGELGVFAHCLLKNWDLQFVSLLFRSSVVLRWLFINRNGGERLGQKVLFTGFWGEIYNPTPKFNFSKVKTV